MLEGRRPEGRRVVVYDCEGYFMGAGLAELLVGEGYTVRLVSGLGQISPLSDETLEGPLLRRHLHRVGVVAESGVEIQQIAAGALSGRDEFGEPWETETDAVVLVTQRLSNEALYLELAGSPESLLSEGIEGLYRIGDCVAPQLLAEVIFDGHRLAREIDSPDPAVPLPYLRENNHPLVAR